MEDFELVIADDAQHERLFVEIWLLHPEMLPEPVPSKLGFQRDSRELFALISQESVQPLIEIFPRSGGRPWSIDLGKLHEILDAALSRLAGD